jgi:hypothetical protein
MDVLVMGNYLVERAESIEEGETPSLILPRARGRR